MKFEEYMIEEELAKNTRESYIFAVRNFFNNYKELNKANIVGWKNTLALKFSPKTVNLRLSAIEKYCEFKEVHILVKRIKEQKLNRVENFGSSSIYKKRFADRLC